MKVTRWRQLQAWGLSSYTGLVWRTARYRVAGLDHIDRAHATGRPLIIAAWHGMTMMLVGNLLAREDPARYVLVVPDDHRGAVLSTWGRKLGGTPFAISMQADSMVAARRLLALIREMKDGRNLILAPDGPDGPSHEPKAGVAFIARRAGASIVPAGAFTNSCIRLPRWDRYVVPLPFSRIAVVAGEPIEVPVGADLDRTRGVLRRRLNEVERAAETLYRAGS